MGEQLNIPATDSIFEIEYIARLIGDRWIIQGRPLCKLQMGDYVGIDVVDESGDPDVVIFEAIVVTASSYILPDLKKQEEGMVAVISRTIDPTDGMYMEQILAAKYLVAVPSN